MRKISTCLRLFRPYIACAAALGVSAAADVAAQDRAASPPVLFSAPLADMPGKQLVVVALTLRPKQAQQPSPGHRHPGSVFVYVTEGTARLGIEGQPVREVHAGESFFEPLGAVHTVGESASATEPASAIAVMIVPDGAPLVLPAK
jgi:quercetin dioxygenase-like cupin family protein